MRMPEFTAETALYQSQGVYRLAGAFHQTDRAISPALLRARDCDYACLGICFAGCVALCGFNPSCVRSCNRDCYTLCCTTPAPILD